MLQYLARVIYVNLKHSALKTPRLNHSFHWQTSCEKKIEPEQLQALAAI